MRTLAGHFAQANREERAFHLAGQHDFEAVARAFVPEDAQVVLRLIDGQKERQALDVVPVGVRQQQGQVERPGVEFGDQLAPQQPQPGAGVEDDDLAIGADLDTGSVAAVMDGGRARGRNGAAHAPELQPRRCRRGTPLEPASSAAASRPELRDLSSLLAAVFIGACGALCRLL